MSDMRENELVPQLTLGWRLKMALNMANLSREQMAEALGVSPATVSRWMADKGAPPRRAFIQAWSNVTHVELHWLESGTMPDVGPTTMNDRSLKSLIPPVMRRQLVTT